jgi:hypothetical protein
LADDQLVPGDFDGDGKTDVAVWRGSDGNWFIHNSSDNSLTIKNWGKASLGDVPVPADYDGDGKTDIAVWRPSEGSWYVTRSTDDSTVVLNLGALGDLPVPAAYIR